jgi:phenylalanyl-tRNA synthetase beta chain
MKFSAYKSAKKSYFRDVDYAACKYGILHELALVVLTKDEDFMRISERWLKEFVDFTCTPHELEAILTMLGLEVEHIDNPAERLRGFVVGHVETREKHPNADKLSVCTVAIGGGQVNTIVCGAPNVSAGQRVAVALEGAVMPNGGFTIAKRKLRGVESNGMICSQEELGLGSDHDGIWVLPETAPVGNPLAEYLGLDDVVYDISITPNRADCLSHLGIAREIAAYFNVPLRKPVAAIAAHHLDHTTTRDHITIRIDDPEVCWRFAARVVRGVKIQPSPEWLQNRLRACGQRPINNVVDITNYVMLECGKPIHAFDVDKVAQQTLIVKRAADGERFTTLDGKERTLDSTMTVVADAERSSALGGIMGGQISEISDATVNVCIESAMWQPSSIRRTAKTLGLSSDAAYRFERGVDIESVVYAADRAAQLIAEIAGGSIAREAIDVYPTPKPQRQATVRYARANMLIGKTIPAAEQRSLLERLGCTVTAFDDQTMTVTIPTHRVDVETETDLIEEIARLYGYDNIHPDLTSRINLSGERTPGILAPIAQSRSVADFLRANGFHETITQNMIDPKSAAAFTEHPVTIANPLGEELSCMRPSLIPSMLKVIERNTRFGQKHLRLFEVGTVFSRVAADEATFITGFKEQQQVLVALAGNALGERGSDHSHKHWDGTERAVDFYDIKGVLESLAMHLRLHEAAFRVVEHGGKAYPLMSPNCVELVASFAGKPVAMGFAGEISSKALKQYDVDIPVFVAVLNLWMLPNAKITPRKYAAVSPYPSVVRDLAFVLDAATEAERVRSAIIRSGGALLRSVRLFDVFVGAEGKSVGAGNKSLAFALEYNSPEKTLADADVEASIAAIVQAVSAEFSAHLRS